MPPPALPLPADAQAFGINPSLPAYRTQDPTPSYRIRDVFMWNLHEALVTPEQFSQMFVNELDLPAPASYAVEVANQIRTQLEDYSGVALHPLFHGVSQGSVGAALKSPQQEGANDALVGPEPFASSEVRARGEPLNAELVPAQGEGIIEAVAAWEPPIGTGEADSPDDAYRCIVILNVNLLSKLFTDKFEWSLLHPPGFAEKFAKQNCADMGLGGEWVNTMAHEI